MHAMLTAGASSYASGLLSVNEGATPGIGSGAGYGYNRIGVPTTFGAASGAPAFCDNAFPVISHNHYAWVDTDVSVGPSRNDGITITNPSAITPIQLDPGLAYKFRVHHAVFASGGGSGRLSSRLGQSPWTTYVTQAISFAGASDRLTHTDLTLGAAERTLAVQFQLAMSAATTGKAWLSYFHVFQPDAVRGCSLTTLYGIGGKTTLQYRDELGALGDTKIAYPLGILAERQADTAASMRKCVVVINGGMNDKSVPNSRADVKRALHDLIDIFTSAWAAAGGYVDDLLFVLMPSHVVGDFGSSSDEQKLDSYRSAAMEIAMSRPRVAAVNLGELMTYSEAIAGSWYQTGSFTDVSHLTEAGVNAIGLRAVKFLMGI